QNHQAFLNEGELLGRAGAGRSSGSPEMRRDLTADKPNQDGEQEKRQGQPEFNEQGEQEQQNKLDGLAKCHRKPSEQAAVDCLKMAGGHTARFSGSKGTKRERAEPIGMLVQGEPEASDGLDGRFGS